MSRAYECSVCSNVCGSFRDHCPACGASRNRVFWLVDGPNTWNKTHIDVDRPIHKAHGGFRNTRVTPLVGEDSPVGYSVTDDVILALARELGDVK
jgi:hypothetical protein